MTMSGDGDTRLADYLPGDGCLLFRDNVALLLALPVSHNAIGECWDLLAGAPDTSGVLDRLVRRFGIADLPPFALAVADDQDELDVTVHRRARARSADEVLVTTAGTPWLTQRVAGEVLLDLGEELPADPAATFPLVSGVVAASAVTLPPGPAPVVETPKTTDADPLPAEEPEPEAPETPAPVPAEPQEVPAEEPEPELEPEPGEAAGTKAWIPDAIPPAEPGGLIDGVPWLDSPAGPMPGTTPGQPVAAGPGGVALPVPPRKYAPPTSEPAPDPAPTRPPPMIEESGVTARQQSVDGTGSAGVMVMAVRCPAGHFTAPDGSVCRTCGADVPPQQAFQVRRPSLGTLVFSTGETVELDRGVVIGRAPTVPAELPQRPHLLNLAVHGRDISRMHAEITLDGWTVLLRDLRSANGTWILRDGHAPQRMRPGEQYTVEHGVAYDIAEVLTFTLEPSR